MLLEAQTSQFLSGLDNQSIWNFVAYNTSGAIFHFLMGKGTMERYMSMISEALNAFDKVRTLIELIFYEFFGKDLRSQGANHS